MLEIIKNDKIIYAIIIRSNYNKEGPNFFTDDKDRLQIGSLIYKKGKLIEPHYHRDIKRISNKSAEVLFIKKGKIKVKFYCNKTFGFLEEKILNSNDTILLQDGAHGFEVEEDVEMIEAKLGPYHQDDLIRINKNE
tara:strand:+ start:7916 stop:8323 length:408 start_codon:yes stop_codon:yes gene_type:complete